MFFRSVLASTVESKSKNSDGETARHLARATIKSNDGCLSPRSIRPRCLTSISTFSATCQIFKFLDLRTDRSKLPNCAAAVMETSIWTINARRSLRNHQKSHLIIDKEASEA